VIPAVPEDAGAVHDKTIRAFPAVAVTDCGDEGADGAATGVADAVPLALEAPADVTANTLKVYATPFVSPTTSYHVAALDGRDTRVNSPPAVAYST
jgi:hypothetical protein